MERPTYYLWRSSFASQTEFEQARSRFGKLGFRVVTYLDGAPERNLNEGMKQLIRNHYDESCS